MHIAKTVISMAQAARTHAEQNQERIQHLNAHSSKRVHVHLQRNIHMTRAQRQETQPKGRSTALQVHCVGHSRRTVATMTFAVSFLPEHQSQAGLTIVDAYQDCQVMPSGAELRTVAWVSLPLPGSRALLDQTAL
uniref:Uncharacterized protein n=1 Tax=Cyanoptyche gloeocystis TaxID=77922 RepID=A0A7S2JQP9_9EUKA